MSSIAPNTYLVPGPAGRGSRKELLGGGATQARPSGKGGERWEAFRQEGADELLNLISGCPTPDAADLTSASG